MMNRKLCFCTLFIAAVLTVTYSFAQDSAKLMVTYSFAQDTAKQKLVQTDEGLIKRQPVYPGGTAAFNKYILKHLKYPDVARVVGLTGSVVVSFVIGPDGSVVETKTEKCMGAACESEAVRVIAQMPKWIPGIFLGKPVRVSYSVPINFYLNMDGAKIITRMKDLRYSDYGFFFYIKGKTYTLDEAQAILGKSFDASTVEALENYDGPQYALPDKKLVYLIVMKDKQE